MAQILVEIDPVLKQSEIVMTLATPGSDERRPETDKNKSGFQQTSAYGILSPLVAINNSVIAFNDVIELCLDGTGQVPTISLTAIDTNNNLENIDKPGQDNELRLQILPQFDNAYKKINLTFYLSTLSIIDGVVSAKGTYKVPKLTSDNIKALGEVDTYELFKQIASETELGFATNTTDDTSDKRFIYCDNKSYLDLMNQQVRYGGSETKIYDFWIDFWNNINLVDIYERYNAIDTGEDLMVWVSGQPTEIIEDVKVQPYKMEAVLTNHPSMGNTDLFIINKEVKNNGALNVYDGTDKLISIYEESKHEYMDHLIQNGTVKKDIFQKYKYLGECYGDQNYILISELRDSFLKIINAEVIEVTTNSPCLGLMRGKQAKLQWYINDDNYKNITEKMEEAGLVTPSSEMTTNVDIDPQLTPEEAERYNTSNGEWVPDKNISGQYLIVGNKIKYSNGVWNNTMSLIRPSENSPHKINVDE